MGPGTCGPEAFLFGSPKFPLLGWGHVFVPPCYPECTGDGRYPPEHTDFKLPWTKVTTRWADENDEEHSHQGHHPANGKEKNQKMIGTTPLKKRRGTGRLPRESSTAFLGMRIDPGGAVVTRLCDPNNSQFPIHHFTSRTYSTA